MKSTGLVTVFGGNGFIGRHVVGKLVKKGLRVRVACKDPQAALFLKPLGDMGQVSLIKANITRPNEVARAVKGAEAVVNCVGILTPSGRKTFDAVHVQGSANIAKAAKDAGVQKLVHISALSANKDGPSDYAKSKAAGEVALLAEFPKAVILRPSIVLGPEDNFLNKFAAFARWSPVVPIIGCPILPKFNMVKGVGTDWKVPSFEFCDYAGTRFQPIYVGDVAQACVNALTQGSVAGKIFELVGPTVYTFRQLMQLMLNACGRHRLIVPYPVPLAYFTGLFMEMIPGKPFSRDLMRLLKTDNVQTMNQKGIGRLNITPRAIESILPGYLATYGPPSKRRLRTREI